MPHEKQTPVLDPDFVEYVYEQLVSANRNKKMLLDTHELKFFRNKSAIRALAESDFTNIGKLLVILTKIGINMHLVFTPDGNTQEPILDKIPRQYGTVADRAGLIKAMHDNKLFVLGSKDVMLSLQMAAQNSHHILYRLNYQHVKMAAALKKEKAGYNKTDEDLNRDSREGFDMLSKMLLGSINAIDESHALAGISKYEMKVLLALYPHRNTYVHISKISADINVPDRKMGVAKVCYWLAEGKYIGKSTRFKGKNPEQAYTILEEGIRVVMDYMKYVSKNALFFD